MTAGQNGITNRVAELRRAFDQTFSEPPVGRAEDFEDLLALGAGGHAYAVRLQEIGGLLADRPIVHLPTPVPAFLGVAGLGHDVVPVYSLQSLLGHALGGDSPRWLIIARGTHPVALAFDEFDGHLRVPASALLTSTDRAVSAHVSATLRLEGGMRGVVSVASVLETIEHRIRNVGPTKEQ